MAMEHESMQKKKLWLAVSLIGNLGLLAIFKYLCVPFITQILRFNLCNIKQFILIQQQSQKFILYFFPVIHANRQHIFTSLDIIPRSIIIFFV